VVTVEVCVECGFDSRRWTDADAVSAIDGLAGRWATAVDGLAEPELQRRPLPTMWSIAEYVDHVREVLFGMRFLLETALTDPGTDLGDPPGPGFDPEPRAVDVDRALRGLSVEAERLRESLTSISPGAWRSTVILGREAVDVHWIARHGVHDPTHHLGDVERLRAAL
jgi:hypothetical protein